MTKHSLVLLVFGHQARLPVKFEIWPDELCSEDESTAENAVLGYTTDFDESDLDGGTVYSAPLSTHSQCSCQKFVSKGGGGLIGQCVYTCAVYCNNNDCLL